MKKILVVAAIFFSVNCSSQVQKSLSSPIYAEAANKPCDENYKMKKYVVAFLMPGEVIEEEPAEKERLEIAHYKNVSDLIDREQLIVAESFVDHQYIKAIYIFNVETIAEARKLVETDPAIIAGKFRMEFHPWFGSVALVKSMGIYKIIEAKNIIE